MEDKLRDSLTPDDDGRAFTDAVLLRAAGALHRRGTAVQAAGQTPAWDWLARWARPWVVAALMVVAIATILPTRPWSIGTNAAAAATVPPDSEAMVASLMPADLALATATDANQER